MDISRNPIEELIASRAVMREPLAPMEKVCETHGPYTSNGTRYLGTREVWSRCPDCQEIMLAAERQAEAEKQAKEASARLEALLQDSAIPPRFIGRTFDNFNASTKAQQDALRITQDFAANFDAHFKRGSGLILSGLPGTGKSHLAGAVLQAIMPKYCGLYTTCMGVIRTVRGTWRKDAERSETDVLNIYGGVPLLVLDEIGVQYGTDGEQTILFDVLDKRYRDMQPTILLTNQAKDGFKQFVGERSYDRMVESCRWVSFDWESYRPTARREAA